MKETGKAVKHFMNHSRTSDFPEEFEKISAANQF